MGDRVSISFVNSKNSYDPESVVLFSHWNGMELVAEANDYVKNLKTYIEENYEYPESHPLSRLEPNTVMIDFIRHITKHRERVTHNFYLGRTERDGDNSNQGHHKIYLE